MDAAQKLSTYIRLSLLPLIALALSSTAWGDTQFSLSSNTVSCSGTSCPSPAGGVVSVNSTGDQITYTVGAPDYSVDASNPTHFNWLSVSPVGGGQTTPGSIFFNFVSASGLTQGPHSATVTLHATIPASGVNDAVITVNYVAGSGGGTGTLFSSISPINLVAASGAQAFSNPSITTTSATNITISVGTSTSSCTGVAWLSASIIGNSTISNGSGTTLQVKADATNLPSGFCQGTVAVTPNVGTVLNISVNFTVGSGSGGTLTA
ncbi:MAG TPA: hypothetical protein VKE70_06750, partial [Candidatus Solibacter sp.]|nr:hypothetical protein [Candidatus Solibacter sp.]